MQNKTIPKNLARENVVFQCAFTTPDASGGKNKDGIPKCLILTSKRKLFLKETKCPKIRVHVSFQKAFVSLNLPGQFVWFKGKYVYKYVYIYDYDYICIIINLEMYINKQRPRC